MAAFSAIIAESFFSNVELTWETAGSKRLSGAARASKRFLGALAADER
jgi:hypothetical protein